MSSLDPAAAGSLTEYYNMVFSDMAIETDWEREVEAQEAARRNARDGYEGSLSRVVQNDHMAKSNGKIQHPSPTTTTAKELYGAAISCGFPECHEPPYRVVNGALALNSQIAHIHARRATVARGNESQGESVQREPDHPLPLTPRRGR